LVDRNVTGWTADVRCRDAAGELLYSGVDRPEKIRALKEVRKHTEKNGVWDYSVKPPVHSKRPFIWFTLRWEKAGSEYDCGYSGRREDCENLNDWHILIDA
jgi:hypothetical protein